MKAIRWGKNILNADLITNCTLHNREHQLAQIEVWYTTGSYTTIDFASADDAEKAFDYLYNQIKEQEHGEM